MKQRAECFADSLDRVILILPDAQRTRKIQQHLQRALASAEFIVGDAKLFVLPGDFLFARRQVVIGPHQLLVSPPQRATRANQDMNDDGDNEQVQQNQRHVEPARR